MAFLLPRFGVAIEWRWIFYRHFAEGIKKPARSGHLAEIYQSHNGR
ncbi:hypothetical protein LTSEJOH_4619 [Salmonella enterica subsp. enterica serovar Johannesburg str. S5-703]|nr:hypothetical protein LTSEJOH_4619 [Salmonella enterica subsp. enterica serovar Johannesburg str. S5-703]